MTPKAKKGSVRPRWHEFGEHVATVTRALKIPECGGCRKRRDALNQLGEKVRQALTS